MIQKLLFTIVLLCACTALASADVTLPDPTDIAAESVSKGLDKFMVRTADSIMSFTTSPVNGSTDGVTADVPGTIVNMIIGFASWSIMPFEYHSVQQIMGISFAIGLFVLLLYVFVGAAYTNISPFTPAGKSFLHIMNGGSSTPLLRNYTQNTVCGCIAMSVSPIAVYLVLMFAQSLKEMSMMSIAGMIAPGESIPFLYLAMSIMWLLLSVFFGVANVVIVLTGAASFLLGALFVSDRTRHIAVGGGDYFFGCAMMQPLVVCGVAAIVAIMTEIATEYPLLWAVSGMDIPMYLGTILGATYLAYRLTLGKTKLIKSASNLVSKLV
jgi:hypothetical protein